MRSNAFPNKNRVCPHAEALIQLALPSCQMNGEWVAGDK